MKPRRVKNGFTTYERLRPDASHPRYAAGTARGSILFSCGKYSRAVQWAKAQPSPK